MCQDSTCGRGKDSTAWGRSRSVEKPWPFVIDHPCVISCNVLKFTQLFILSVMSVSFLGTEMKSLVQPEPWYPVTKDLLHSLVGTDNIRPGMHIYTAEDSFHAMCRLMPFLILFPAPVTYRETSKFNDRQSKCKQCFLQEKDGRARTEIPGTH